MFTLFTETYARVARNIKVKLSDFILMAQTQAHVANKHMYCVLGCIGITGSCVMVAISTTYKKKSINVTLPVTILTNSFYNGNSSFIYCHYGGSPHT